MPPPRDPAVEGIPPCPSVDILLPTCNRHASLICALTGIASQTETDLRVVVADQSDRPAIEEPVIKTLFRVIQARGSSTLYIHRQEKLGIAEQRQFLLEQARAETVMYLDDDVLMEPWVLARLRDVLIQQQCGFVGAFPSGLSFESDVRPDQQIVEFWDGPVQPEAVEPGSLEWGRNLLHRAANVWHASRGHSVDEPRFYKVAWVASCVLYDRAKLEAVGGFQFWHHLPRYHSGEEVLVQNLLMRRWGGCAIMPSGTYHTELPSTVLNSEGGVDGHALDLLPEMVNRYAPIREPMGVTP